jgi:hypothetical protein
MLKEKYCSINETGKGENPISNSNYEWNLHTHTLFSISIQFNMHGTNAIYIKKIN